MRNALFCSPDMHDIQNSTSKDDGTTNEHRYKERNAYGQIIAKILMGTA